MILRKQLISSSIAHKLVMQKDTHVPISCVMSVNHDLYQEFKRMFVDNSLLILIEGNENRCAVVFYRSAYRWLPIMSSTSPPTPVTSLLHQDFCNSGLKGKKKWLATPLNEITVYQWPFPGFFKFGHKKVKENPSALIERTLNICKITRFESDTS